MKMGQKIYKPWLIMARVRYLLTLNKYLFFRKLHNIRENKGAWFVMMYLLGAKGHVLYP